MKHKTLLKSEEQDVFTDLLFNALLGFAFMFAIAFMLINNSEESGNINTKAEVLISVQWPDEHPDDVDAVVEDCLLYTSPSPRDGLLSRMPSSA